jgi:hypothetical protein
VVDTSRSTGSDEEEVVRYVNPDEWASTQADCLKDEGWIVEITPDGSGLKFPDVAPEQAGDMEAAADRCLARYPVDPRFYQPLDDDQLELVYDWYVNTEMPCLTDLGYSGFEPPSLETFKETWTTQSHWDPVPDVIDQIDANGPDVLSYVYRDCPRYPPMEELFPED